MLNLRNKLIFKQTEAVPHRSSYKKLFQKYAANLPNYIYIR